MAVTDGNEYGHIDIKVGENAVRHPFKDVVARESISDLSDTVEAHFPDADKLVAGTGSATGDFSSAIGAETTASHRSQHVFGEYNIADNSAAEASERGTYVEIVGNGAAGENDGEPTYSNARTLDWQGNETLSGDLTVNAGSENETSIGDIIDRVDALESGTSGVGDHFPATGRFFVGTGSATADYAVATGVNTTAGGTSSHAEGVNTVANHKSQHVFGEYNIADDSDAEASERGNYVEIVGNGSDDDHRGNARTLDWDGNEEVAGNFNAGGDITGGGELAIDGDATIGGSVDVSGDITSVGGITTGGSITIGGTEELDATTVSRLKALNITNQDFQSLVTTVGTLNDVTVPAIASDVAAAGTDLTIANDKLYLTHDNVRIGNGVEFSAGVGFDSGYMDDNGYVHITMDGTDVEDFTPFYIGTGGSGTGGGGAASIVRVTDASTNCVFGDSMPIVFTFTATDASGDTVGDGVGTWYVGGIAVATNIVVHQGQNSFDISPYLSAGTNTVKLYVSVDTGGEVPQRPSKTWTVNAVNMYFTWSYNDAQINTGAFSDRWTPYGDVLKTTHTLLDGNELEPNTTTRSGVLQAITIPMQSHGAHRIERWITATIGDDVKSTDHQYHEAIFVEDGNTTPIIAISMADKTNDDAINQYDTIRIPVVVYDPTSLLATATLSIDNTPVGTWTNIDRSVQYWSYTASTAGTHTLSVSCKGVTSSVVVDVNALDLDVEEVGGYSFKFKASELATNNAAINWSSNGVTATYSDNFDWVNGGLHTETDSNDNMQQYFCIKAGTRMTINHKMFKSSPDPKSSGMNYKIIFKVKNVREYDAQIGHCYADNVGIRMYAHKSLFNSTGTEISVPYGEDEYIELEFDVYPAPVREGDGNFRYMMAWLDGVITSCRVYGENDNFVQSSENQENIVLGSDDCDIYIYMVKAYPMIITRDNHIDNFIMDAPNASEMMRRYDRNNILDDYGEISYEKLMNQNKDCRIFLHSIKYMTNSKDDKVSGDYFQQFWKNGDKYYEISGTGKMSVQGTSSVQYLLGAANTDINFSALTDGNGNDLLAGGTQDSAYGNNWFVEDSQNAGHAKVYTVAEAREAAGLADSNDPLGPEWVAVERNANKVPTKYIKALGFKLNDDSCPITYSNTKVNFASCEQVNNMCNAAWYQRFNPYPSLTARDCMEFVMGVQFIKDRGEPLPDDKHFRLFPTDNKYHMYSIANMGNSKKNVHIFHDLANPNEVCVEVCDNNAEQMRMVNDDLSLQDWTGKVEGKKKYFEMRYPDVKDPSQEVKDAWQRLVTWMATNNPAAATGAQLATPETYDSYVFKGHDRAGTQVLKGTVVTQYAGTYTHDTFERRMAKMLSECEDYMVMDSFVYHYLYLERHTMVDNVSKNNFWSSTDLIHWDLSKAYDMDTSDGNNNQGQLVFDYGNEWNDTTNEGKTVFNANDSVWFVFVANLYEACQTMFTNREALGAWSYARYHEFLLSEQQKVPERCWNQCYWYDYLRTNEQNLGAWMSFLDGGQKTHQRSHYEYFEEMYDASKYRGTVSTANNINFRAYKPAQWGGSVSNVNGARLRRSASSSASTLTTVAYGEIVYVQNTNESIGDSWRKVVYDTYTGYMLIDDLDIVEPAPQISIAMYNKMYIAMNAGTTAATPIKANRGTLYTIDFPVAVDTGGTQVVIYSASMIQTVSGMERLFPDTCNFSQATRLRELTIGSSSKGYSNQFLGAASGETLSLESNTMLERLYVQNLPNARSNLVLSNCPALLYVDATGSGFTGYEFADGGLLNTAILNRPTSLVMRNMSYLTDAGLTIADYTGLVSLRIENTPNVDSLTIFNSATGLRIARLLGVNWRLQNSAPIDRLYSLQGLDENGFTVNRAVVTGEAFVPIIRERNWELYHEEWPTFTINYTNFSYSYDFTFLNADGTPIKDKNGNDYVQLVDRNYTAYEPVAAGDIDEPEMRPDAQYEYNWVGWDNLDGVALGPRTVTAVYEAVTRQYTVRWLDEIGGRVLKSVTVPYGSEVTYSDDPHDFPTYTAYESENIYSVFKGWNKSTGFITEDTDVYAIWDTFALRDDDMGQVELYDMPISQIYGIARTKRATEYWQDYDYVDITVGHDYSFINVESSVIAENMYFDGTNPLVTNIQLFKADAPTFTLAIDYEFASTVANASLVSCYDPDGDEGFRFMYNGGPVLQWGDKTTTNPYIGYGMRRGIIVIKHYKGDKTLYIMSDKTSSNSSNYSLSVYKTSLTRANTTETNAYLTLGDMSYVTDEDASPQGWVHWCKVWYADLGDTVIEQIANWPHETWRMHYYGAARYKIANNEGPTEEDCAASFIANALLPMSYTINTSGTIVDASGKEVSASGNMGGWKQSAMRRLTNGRCYDALPVEWQFVVRTVAVPSSFGNQSPEIVYGLDKMYLPAIHEVSTLQAYSVRPYNEEGERISWYTNDSTSRMKFLGIILQKKPSSTDGTFISAGYDPSVDNPDISSGTVWYNSTTGVVRIYIDEETSRKHGYIGGTAKSSGVKANGANGGYWIPSSTWASRSPYIGDSTQWVRLSATGGSVSTTSSYANILLCLSI